MSLEAAILELTKAVNRRTELLMDDKVTTIVPKLKPSKTTMVLKTIPDSDDTPDLPGEPIVPDVKPKRKRRTKAEMAAEKAKTAVTVSSTMVDESEVGPITLDDLTDNLRQLLRDKTPEIARAILAEFGADKISAVPEDRYSDCMAAMKKARAD